MTPTRKSKNSKKAPSQQQTHSLSLTDSYASGAEPTPDPVHGVRGTYCDDILNGKLLCGTPYRVGKRIGGGAFGEIRMVRDIKTNHHLAVKLERNSVKPSQLSGEWELYSILNKNSAVGIPRVFHFCSCGTCNAMVLELLGPSLEQIFKMCQLQFSLHTILMTAIQLITRIESVHSCHIVNLDIKPENCLIHKPPNRDTTIFITDFGLGKLFIDPHTGSHIVRKQGQRFVGTASYASINAHMGIEQSRRDDLESLGYCLIYFLRGSLPWHLRESTQAPYKEILNMKKNISLDELCKGEQEFTEYMRYVRNLKFEQTPDYDLLRNLFMQRMEKEGYDPKGDMDWTSKVANRVRMRQLQRLFT